MLGSSMDNKRSRIREHAHWVLIMERALAQYGLSLSHSSLAQQLTRSPLPASLFIAQANANLIRREALRLAGDDRIGLRLNPLHSPSAIGLLALAASTPATIGAACEPLPHFIPTV